MSRPNPIRPPARQPHARHLAPALALAAGCALAGCAAVGPDFVKPEVSAPAQWSAAHGGSPELAAPPTVLDPLPADRWSVFGDEQLLRLQRIARDANQDVKAATLRLLQARVSQRIASAQRGVQVNAQGTLARERQSEYGLGSRLVTAIGGANAQPLLDVLGSPFTLYQAGFDASWEPDLWGRVLRTEEAASAGADEKEALARQVQLGVVAELARSYFALRAAQAGLALARDELDAALAAERLLVAQRDRGLADDSAVLRQRAQVAALRAAIPALLAQEAQATNVVTLLCAASPGALNGELSARAGAGAPAERVLRAGLPIDVLRRRPDVAAAEARLHAATAGIGIATADLYPRIVIGASFGLESVYASKFSDWDSRQWSVGASVSLPIFDNGRRRATVVLRELQQQEAAVAFQQAVLKAWHEVDDALSAYVAETRRREQALERVRAGEEEAALSRARHANGLTDFLPVLRATSALLEARRELVDSGARMDTALAAVLKALGAESDEPRGPDPA